MGKDFEAGEITNANTGFIINEEAASQLKLKFTKKSSLGDKPVVAIVRNFNVHTMYDPINPTIFTYQPGTFRTLLIRCEPGASPRVMKEVQRVWKSLAPDLAFDGIEFSESLKILYHRERSFGYMVTGFTLLAFIVMGMGLFGLALLISERKVKETAVRKIFGATNTRILWGMQKEFLAYVLAASAVAIPMTWVILTRWLNTFNYRVSIPWWIFAAAIAIVTLFVSAVIFTRTLKLLNENPIKALKYE